MAKPKFYLDTTISSKGLQAIKLLYSFNGQRLKYHTQVSVDKKHFQEECNNSNKKPIKSIAPYCEQLNLRLSDIALDAVKIVNELKGDKLTVAYVREQLDLIYKHKVEPTLITKEINHTFISFFETFVEDCKTGKRVLPTGKNKGGRYSHNAIKNYNVTLSAIRRFMKHFKLSVLNTQDINKEFYDNFRFYCFDVEEKEISTFAGYVKDIKTIMSYAAPETFKSKDFITPGYEADTIYLTLEQIDNIANLDLSDYSTSIEYRKGKEIDRVGFSTLDKVRDLFLIGCFTGLRFSDFSILELKSIEGNFIKIKQTKTGGRITIPIMSRLRPVLNKYTNGLPTISNQQFNNLIKQVCKLAGLTEKIKFTTTKGNKTNEETQELYSLVSSHICRRSYATNMFKAGVPPMLIMSATGHQTESSFLRYIRASNEDKANLLAETYKKLGL